MGFHAATALALLTAATSALAAPPAAMDGRYQPPDPVGRAVERFNLGLRGVYFVENRGQWSDESVHYGLKSRGLDVAFRESSFTMHLSRERSEPGCATPTSRAREEAGLTPSSGIAGEGGGGGYWPTLVRDKAMSGAARNAPLPHGRGSSGDLLHHEIRGVEDSAPACDHLTLTVSFPGSNPVTPRGAQPQTAKFNYFVGGEGRGTASNVPSFGAVVYENLYNGIDLLVTGNDDGVMKYEFHCAPGADYSQIRIHYEGIDSLCVNDDGDLEIATSFGTLLDGAPIVWQEGVNSLPRLRGGGPGRGSSDLVEMPISASAQGSIHPHPDPPPQSRGREQSAAARQTIPARFKLIDAATYRIALDAAPDPAQPLVIDPEIEWMVYLGGSHSEGAHCIVLAEQNLIFLAGHTWSRDFESQRNSFHGGNFDAYLCKVDAAGALQWTTYLGGTGDEVASCIALQGNDRVFITGWTGSSDFEGRRNEYGGKGADGYLISLDLSGNLQWMLYLGGDGFDYANCLNCERPDEVLVSGGTDSTDFEGRVNAPYGNLDAFVASVHVDGQIAWMRYYGGTRYDIGYGLATGASNDLILTGHTNSPDFVGGVNEHRGGFDGFLLHATGLGMSPTMRYFGGSGDDRGGSLARDRTGGSVCTGHTVSSDFEGRINQYQGNQDVFVVRFTPFGTLDWMAYVGGSEEDDATQSVCISNAGQITLFGDTLSDDIPRASNRSHGERDGFLAALDPNGAMLWSQYLGGSDDEFAYGLLLAPDDTTLFVCGATRSLDFDGRRNKYYGGSLDAFLVELHSDDPIRLSIHSTCPSGGPIRIEWSGASPGGQIALIYARNTGSFIIPNNRPCAGTQLGLGSNQIQLAWQGGAGANGSRTLNTTAGPGACGGYLQLLDLATCGTSNVARIE